MKSLLHALAAAAVILSTTAPMAAPRVLNTCATITDPGAYVVGRNIAATGDCFVIAADFVNLDLDGFVIAGNGSGSGVVEQLAAGRKSVTVKNGVITGFLRAVYIPNSTGATVDGLTASGNLSNAITVGDNATATRNQVSANSGTGLVLGFRSLASGNNVSDNTGAGILANNGANITGNTVGHNGGSGISVAEGAVISNNVSRNNTSYGIVADCPSLVIGNTTTNNIGGNLQAIGGACDPNSQTCCVLGVNNMALSSF